MKKIFILVVLLSLIPVLGHARKIGDLTANSGAVIDFSDAERFGIPTGAFGDMPTVDLESGNVYWVTDSGAATSCSSGGAGYKVLCIYNGAIWAAIGGTGGGEGEVQFHLMTPNEAEQFATQTDNDQNLIVVGDLQAANFHDDGSSVFLGANEHTSLSGSTRNTVVGIGSGAAITSGTDNVSIGYQAALANNGSNNIAIGDTTLTGNTTGVDNIVIGANAGDSTSSSSRNVVIGNDAASEDTIGDDNIFIGNDSAKGGALSDNIFIGPNPASTQGSKLYIDSGAETHGLINGDFASRLVDIDGYFSVEQGQAINLISTSITLAENLDTVLPTQKAVKAYADNLVGSGLEEVTEDSKTGWRLKGQPPTYYGDIGQKAVDLSISTSPSSTRGATGMYAFAEGYNTTASGDYSHAEGILSIASGQGAHAESGNTASGYHSHAEGEFTTASGSNSHTEGKSTAASGAQSHAEGLNTNASGANSHAEGNGTTAWESAHAEGISTTAIGRYSHAEGQYTYARNTASHAAGKFNVGTSTETIHETGIGTEPLDKRNAFEIYLDGTLTAPDATIQEITDRAALTSPVGRVLITKEYLDTYGSAVSGNLNDLDDVTTATGPDVDQVTDGSNADDMHVHTAITGITDFDAEVANNTDVATNTTHRGLTDNPHSVTATQVGAQPLDTDLTTLTGDTAYRMFANNASGIMTAYEFGSTGYAWISNGPNAIPTWQATGVGDVIGPSSSVDNQITKFSGTGGKTIQEAQMSEDASGNVVIVGSVSASLYSQPRGAGTPLTYQRWYEAYDDGNNYVTVEASADQSNSTGKIKWPAVSAGVTETVAMLSDIGAGFDTTSIINTTWGANTDPTHTWTWDTGVVTDPTMIVSDTGHVFNKVITADTFTSTNSSGGINAVYPEQAGAPVASTEEFFYNSNGNIIYYEEGTSVGYVATVMNVSNKVPLEKDLVITLPTNDDDYIWYKASATQKVTSFTCIVDPTLDTSDTIDIEILECLEATPTSCTAILTTAITVTDAGVSGTISANDTITAGNWVRWNLSNLVNTVDALTCTLGGNY